MDMDNITVSDCLKYQTQGFYAVINDGKLTELKKEEKTEAEAEDEDAAETENETMDTGGLVMFR